MEELKHNELIGKKYKKICKTLSYVEFYFYWLYFNFCFLISVVGIPVGIASSGIGSKICIKKSIY